MTNTITLNYDRLAGLEPGTEEFGIANLKMMMDFAVAVVDDISLEGAIAAAKGEVETPVLNPVDLAKYIGLQVYEQSRYHADLWVESWGSVLPEVIKFWAKSASYNYIQEDGSIWVDLEELVAEMNAAEAA
tara:strand:+ start:119 stop:511 length:393 start_codon:yes stop_codon:yes gene_type:complete